MMGVTFQEFVVRMGVYAPTDALISHGYALSEERETTAPHGFPWHTSFHVSQLTPVEHACVRKLVLGLLDLPLKGQEPDQEGRSIMDAGKDGELQIVRRLRLTGRLISTTDSDGVQEGFQIPDYWLTGNPDAVVVLPGWNRPHVIEMKGCDNEHEKKPKFKLLQSGELEPEVNYVSQLQGYINLAYLFGKQKWPDLDPCETGSIVYFNRARPAQRIEFFYERDGLWFKRMLNVLSQAKQAFLDGSLPDHPFEGKGWTQVPCNWCQFKGSYCKPMWKVGETALRAVEDHARLLDPDYNYELKVMGVKMRWA